MATALLVIAAFLLALVALRRPYYGLLFMFALYPLDSLVPLPKGLSIGRAIALISVAGWFWQMHRRGGIYSRIQHLRSPKLVAPFAVVCIVACLWNSPDFATVMRAVTVVLLVILGVMVEDLIVDLRHMRLLVLVVALSCASFAVLPVASYFGVYLPGSERITYIGTGERLRSAGIADNPNGLGLILNAASFLLTLLLLHRRSLASGIALGSLLAFSVMGVILSASRTHFVGLVAFFAIINLLRMTGPQRGLLTFLVVGTVGIGIFATAYQAAPRFAKDRLIVIGENRGSSAIGRADFARAQWREALSCLEESPLVGVGLGGFIRRGDWDPHDTPSAVVGETGILGAAAFYLIVGASAVRLWRACRISTRARNPELFHYSLVLLSAVGSMLVSSFGGYVLLYQRLFWLIVGLSVIVEAMVRRPRFWFGGAASELVQKRA